MPVGRLVFKTDGRRSHPSFLYDQDWIDNPRGFDFCPQMPRCQVHREKGHALQRALAEWFFGRGGRYGEARLIHCENCPGQQNRPLSVCDFLEVPLRLV